MVVFPLMLAFAALAIDLGRLYQTRCELQRAADAAVLAGTSAYVSQAALEQDHSALTLMARERAQRVSKANPTLKAGTLLDTSDIKLGTHNPDNWQSELANGGDRWNAVELTVRRSPGSLNGGVDFFFARIFGIFEGSVRAKARAAVDDHFAGYDLRKNTRALLPFTIDEKLYEQMAASGADSYSFSPVMDSVGASSDGVSEVHLFPWRLNDLAGVDGEDGSGNFGTLNVGVGSQSTSYLGSQIEGGIPDADLQAEFGTKELMFYDESGAPKTYSATGNPGLSAGMTTAVKARVGDVVGFFVHNYFSQNGSNVVYTISGIRFGRLMYIDLTGKITDKVIVIQPTPYSDDAVIVEEHAPSSNGEVLKVTLVQ